MSSIVKAKEISKWGQIFASLWIICWSAYKFISTPETITIFDIIISGAGIVGCFSPVFLSIIVDKIKGGVM